MDFSNLGLAHKFLGLGILGHHIGCLDCSGGGWIRDQYGTMMFERCGINAG